MLKWMFSVVPWEAASQKQQKNQTKQKKKNSRHWGTQIGGPQHDNLLTLKEANTGMKEKARLRSTHQATERELIDTQLQHLQHSATEQ